MDATSSNDDFQDTLKKLSQKYREEIPEKLKLLRKYIDELKSDPQESTLKALRLEVHKMAGSAGSFGFPRTSEICKEFEKEILQVLSNFSLQKTSGGFIEFEKYLSKLQDSLSTKSL